MGRPQLRVVAFKARVNSFLKGNTPARRIEEVGRKPRSDAPEAAQEAYASRLHKYEQKVKEYKAWQRTSKKEGTYQTNRFVAPRKQKISVMAEKINDWGSYGSHPLNVMTWQSEAHKPLIEASRSRVYGEWFQPKPRPAKKTNPWQLKGF